MTYARPRSRWRRVGRIAIKVVVPALVGLAVAAWGNGSALLGWDPGVVFWVGFALLVLAAGLQVQQGIADERAISTTDEEVNDLRIAMKDSLLPLATLLAELPGKTKGKREEHIKQVAQKATEVLAFLLLKHVKEVRANLFVLSPDSKTLGPVAFSGHGDKPGTFRAGYPAGEDALRRVKKGDPLFCADVKTDPPVGWSRKDAPYRSFISVPVRGGGYAYGMLTVDATQPESFTDTDMQVVRVVAEMLAVGFAIAFPGQNAGTKG